MTELKDKFSQYVCKRVPELKVTDSGLMDLLVVACDHDMEAQLEALIPKVVNLPLSHLEKYFTRIKPAVVIYIQNLMLRKFAPISIDMSSGINGHNFVSMGDGSHCFYCQGLSTTSRCKTCQYICNTCASIRLCSAPAQKVCNFCNKSEVCECGSAVLKKIMDM